MLLAGNDDGVYRVSGVRTSAGPTVERVFQSGRVLRLRTFDGVDGVFAATKTGLFHSPEGDEWTDLGVPREQVYAVGMSVDRNRLYAGTRPAGAYVARLNGAAGLADRPEWTELDAFRELASRDGWGIDRHENRAQVRDLRVPAEVPDHVVAAVEVGGVYVSEDGGDTWTDRRIEGFDAPHTDDVHHVTVEGRRTVTAATGSGLYRTTDAGRTWTRLDTGHRQEYFREAFVHDGTLLAGGSPTPPSSWDEDAEHALFERRDGRTRTLEAVSSPTPAEVAVGWCEHDGGVLAVTHRGTLLHRRSGTGGWQTGGSIPTPERVHGRCLPLASYEP